MTRWMLDATADTLPPGLIGTPFEAVYRALREVAAGVWDVDPAAYRAGIAWAFYLLERPALLERFAALVAAALVSEGVPAIRPDQTPAELVALLRVWFSYRPTYARLEALLACYGVEAEVRPISDPDCQLVLPVSDTRLAFYIRILGMDWTRPLTVDEIAEIARLASPLGSRPTPFYALQAGEASAYVASAGAGIVYSLISGAVAQAVPGIPVGGTIDATSQTTVYLARTVGAVIPGAPVRNPKDFDLQTDSVPLDLGGEVIPGAPVRNPKDFELSGSMPLDGGTISEDTGIDIDCYWGDTVTIPAGYTVQSVKSSELFLSKQSAYQGMNYSAFWRTDAFSTSSNYDASYFGLGVAPCLEIFLVSDTTQETFHGYYLSWPSSKTPGGTLPVAYRGVKANEDGYVFWIDAAYSNTTDPYYVESQSHAYFCRIRLYDANGDQELWAFDFPSAFWQYQNGAFTWLGDPSQGISTGVYYYSTHGKTLIRIHCVPA